MKDKIIKIKSECFDLVKKIEILQIQEGTLRNMLVEKNKILEEEIKKEEEDVKDK